MNFFPTFGAATVYHGLHNVRIVMGCLQAILAEHSLGKLESNDARIIAKMVRVRIMGFHEAPP